MKKAVTVLFLCAVAAFCMTSCASNKTKEVSVLPATLQPAGASNDMNPDLPFPGYYFGEDNAYNDIYADRAGNVIFGREDRDIAEQMFFVPPEFSNGCVILSYSQDYWYNGKKRTGDYELIYYNIYPEKKFKDAIPERPAAVQQGDVLGVSFADTGVIIRCKRPDEHLVACARFTPKYDGNYWYFSVESLSSSVFKMLLFQPVSSRKDEITFHTDGLSETLEEITLQSDAIDHPCSYPAEGVCFVTQLSDYPEVTKEIRSMAELFVRQQNFTDLNGDLMSLDITVDFDGLTWHFMYPNYYLDYLTDEYTLGDDIYLYGNICYSLDGELYLYGRDFQQFDPVDEVELRMKNFTYANFGDNSLR